MSSYLFRSASDVRDPEGIPQQILVRQLHQHPHNPRLFMREDVIAQIQASMGDYEFDPRYAIVVREDQEYNNKYWIISGHHRVEAARRAGKGYVWAWVRTVERGVGKSVYDELDYMELLRSNAQSDLMPLERGFHALGMVHAGKHGQSLNAYAEAVGRPESSVRREVRAAEIAALVRDSNSSTWENLKRSSDYHRQLAEIEVSPNVGDGRGQAATA